MAMRGNKNASGKRVNGERVAVNLSVSEGNGLRPLFAEYLSRQGIEPTDEAIKALASESAYRYWGEWLKREIETQDAAIIL